MMFNNSSETHTVLFSFKNRWKHQSEEIQIIQQSQQIYECMLSSPPSFSWKVEKRGKVSPNTAAFFKYSFPYKDQIRLHTHGDRLLVNLMNSSWDKSDSIYRRERWGWELCKTNVSQGFLKKEIHNSIPRDINYSISYSISILDETLQIL